jgi:hypothetical protein
MFIDRTLVKSQAKTIIKSNVIKLFIICIVVYMLTGVVSISSTVSSIKNIVDETKSYFSDSNDDSSLFEFNFDNGDDDNSNQSANNSSGYDADHFSNFTGKISLVLGGYLLFNIITTILVILFILVIAALISNVITILLMPLMISLSGLFLGLIRGGQYTLKECFSEVFSKTFDKNYWKKFSLCLLKVIIITLGTLLFVILGLIFYYKYYFAQMIMADNPEMSSIDALKLSSKITKHHKGELFLLDLSFLNWGLIAVCTLGISTIYSTPYYNTVRALYFQNFKLRAIAEYAVQESDFIAGRTYFNPNANQNPNQNGYADGQGNYYNPYNSPNNGYYTPNNNQNANDYYNPNQGYYNGNYNNQSDSNNNDYGSSQNNDYFNNNY